MFFILPFASPLLVKKYSFFCILHCFPGLELPNTLRQRDKRAGWNGGGPTKGDISLGTSQAIPIHLPFPRPQKMHRPSTERPALGTPATPKERQCSLVFEFIAGTRTPTAQYSRRVHLHSAGAGGTARHTRCTVVSGDGRSGPLEGSRGRLLTTGNQNTSALTSQARRRL